MLCISSLWCLLACYHRATAGRETARAAARRLACRESQVNLTAMNGPQSDQMEFDPNPSRVQAKAQYKSKRGLGLPGV